MKKFKETTRKEERIQYFLNRQRFLMFEETKKLNVIRHIKVSRHFFYHRHAKTYTPTDTFV